MSAAVGSSPPDVTAAARRLSPVAGAALGVSCAVLALVPWLAGGARLPQQVLWAEPVPSPLPVALLPLSPFSLIDVLAVLVVGPALAGAALRLVRRSRRMTVDRRSVLGAGAGVLGVQAVTGVQALTTVASGLPERTASDAYLAALALLVATGVGTGLVLLALLTAEPKAPVVLGVTLAALLAGAWTTAVLSPLGLLGVLGPVGGRLGTNGSLEAAWLAPVAVGAVIGWAGLRTRGRALAAAAALLLLWAGPAVITAVTMAVGYRVAWHYPGELVGYGAQVLQASLSSTGSTVRAFALAAAVAVVVGGAIAVARRGTPRRDDAGVDDAGVDDSGPA